MTRLETISLMGTLLIGRHGRLTHSPSGASVRNVVYVYGLSESTHGSEGVSYMISQSVHIRTGGAQVGQQ
jgi:hypothetical protein